MSCSKAFSMSVLGAAPPQASCIDFLDWAWTAQSVFNGSWSALGGVFTTTANPGGTVYLTATGITYTGPEVTCLIPVTITRSNVLPGEDASFIEITLDAVVIKHIDVAALPDGLSVIDFIVPQSNFALLEITVYTDIFASAAGVMTVSSDVTCLSICYFNSATSQHVDCDEGCSGSGGDGSIAEAVVASLISQNDADNQAIALAVVLAEEDAVVNCSRPVDVSSIPIVPGVAPGSMTVDNYSHYSSVSGTGDMRVENPFHDLGSSLAFGSASGFSLSCTPTGQVKVTLNFEYHIRENAASGSSAPFFYAVITINGETVNFHDAITPGPPGPPGTCKSLDGANTLSLTKALTAASTNSILYQVEISGYCGAVIPNIHSICTATVTIEAVP